ncbi:hypothetical protein KY290_005492 [Solanum tuberosum]|uniref:BED-type domain-containing protein n=1 Tax=Solanum tuberosum TaxID=4113 RepID=A0ABQ7WEA8_SOLTU|nr:hypothetical protein KY289_005881 [Solanum tuberosum]KAH0779065.1 hypothetical protein KY290_005492 [Solanum tuberosum]
MTEIGSEISESGASNETIHNTPSPNEVEADIEASKKRKAMEPRAACWKHFEKFIDKDGATKAKCNYCGKTYAAIKVDNASSNSVTVKEISKQLTNWGTNIMEDQHLHVRCMAHILNFIVQDGLKEVGQSVKQVSGSKYVTNNVHFVEIAELDLILKEMTENEDSNLKKMAEMDKYMKALFDHYVKKSSKVSLFSSSSPTSSENSSGISSVNGDDNFQKRGSMRTKLEFVRHKVVSGSSSSKSELGRYLAEDVEPETDDFDILKWSSLTPKLVQALISLQDWYRSEPIPINVEEDLEYLELLELDMAHSGNESSIVDV